MLTPTECESARAKLQWTRERLAAEAGVSLDDVIAFELEEEPARPGVAAALTGALEAALTLLPSRPMPARESHS